MADTERAITDAITLVEGLGASKVLTNAVWLLAEARNRVADHVEGRRTSIAPQEPAFFREALERIWMHSCQCSPEIAFDDEQKECASCIAGFALGKIKHLSVQIVDETQ